MHDMNDDISGSCVPIHAWVFPSVGNIWLCSFFPNKRTSWEPVTLHICRHLLALAATCMQARRSYSHSPAENENLSLGGLEAMRHSQCLKKPWASSAVALPRPPLLAAAALIWLRLVMVAGAAVTAGKNTIGLPGCPTSCGGVSVPYPLGIEPGCSLGR
jgi:hypothetical protein